MTDEILWRDPPPPSQYDGSGGGRWQRFARQLAEHPGKWAYAITKRNRNDAASVGSRLRKAGCETALRVQDGGDCDVYARWPEDAT